MADKRNIKRLRKRMQVRFALKGVSGTGFTENIAPGGLMIQSVRSFAPGTIVSGRLVRPTGAEMNFDGEIRWVRKVTGPLAQVIKSTMGLKFTSAPDEAYYKLFMAPESPQASADA